MLNRIKTKAKNDYYNQRFQQYKNNLKETWKLIGTLIKRMTKGQSNYPSRLIRKNKTCTKQIDIAEQFNHYFINVGPDLTSMMIQVVIILLNI